mgnify:CR=1 FL=1
MGGTIEAVSVTRFVSISAGIAIVIIPRIIELSQNGGKDK